MIPIEEIEEYVTRIGGELDSYVLIIDDKGAGLIEKNYHFCVLIEDSEAAHVINEQLITLGIEVLHDYKTFFSKYPKKPHYPIGFPEQLKGK